MTIKNLEIKRNVGVRPKGNVNIQYYVWFVDKGQRYDTVCFGVEECPKLRFWPKTICVPIGYPNEKCEKLAEVFAKHIKEKDIREINSMLDEFSVYGCD